jgi:hypothetical protein
VLRELEGLSYREIGERMGMSRPAVESTLFRARRRLSEEYDELASGQRCIRIQSIIANVGRSGRLGARDTRKLARHVAHCQPCRRAALAAGVDSALVARRPLRERVAEKVAALFPFPLLLRGRRDGGGGSGDGWMSQLPVMSDHAATGGAKLAAVAAIVVAGLGAGVGTHVVPVGAKSSGSPAAKPAKSVVKRSSPAAPARVTPTRSAPAAASRGATRSHASSHPTRSLGGAGSRTTSRGTRQARGGSGGSSSPGTGAGVKTPEANVPSSVPGTQSAPRAPSPRGSGSAPSVTIQVPSVDPNTSVPAATIDTGPVVDQVAGAVQQTTDEVTQAVQDTTGTVQQTTQGVLGG